MSSELPVLGGKRYSGAGPGMVNAAGGVASDGGDPKNKEGGSGEGGEDRVDNAIISHAAVSQNNSSSSSAEVVAAERDGYETEGEETDPAAMSCVQATTRAFSGTIIMSTGATTNGASGVLYMESGIASAGSSGALIIALVLRLQEVQRWCEAECWKRNFRSWRSNHNERRTF